jgi:hypothetical protein
MSTFLDRFKRSATLIGGPMDGRVVPIPLPDSMPLPEYTCMGAPGPSPRVWHHYVRAADGYRHAGACAGIEHHGGAPHDHCEHQWRDSHAPGHNCGEVCGHGGDHVCGCCDARLPS